MQVWLAGFIAALIPKLLEYLWSKASEEVKEQLAHAQIKKHIEATMKSYENLILQYDELKDSGKVTPDDIEKLRLEKIKIEENLFNTISKRS